MYQKMHVKKGDIVKVITGESKGKQGKILFIDIKNKRAVVEGLNMISKHTKPNAASPQGGIIKKEASMHVSNLMVVGANDEASKIGRKMGSDNKLVRYSKKSGEEIK